MHERIAAARQHAHKHKHSVQPQRTCDRTACTSSPSHTHCGAASCHAGVATPASRCSPRKPRAVASARAVHPSANLQRQIRSRGRRRRRAWAATGARIRWRGVAAGQRCTRGGASGCPVQSRLLARLPTPFVTTLYIYSGSRLPLGESVRPVHRPPLPQPTSSAAAPARRLPPQPALRSAAPAPLPQRPPAVAPPAPARARPTHAARSAPCLQTAMHVQRGVGQRRASAACDAPHRRCTPARRVDMQLSSSIYYCRVQSSHKARQSCRPAPPTAAKLPAPVVLHSATSQPRTCGEASQLPGRGQRLEGVLQPGGVVWRRLIAAPLCQPLHHAGREAAACVGCRGRAHQQVRWSAGRDAAAGVGCRCTPQSDELEQGCMVACRMEEAARFPALPAVHFKSCNACHVLPAMLHAACGRAQPRTAPPPPSTAPPAPAHTKGNHGTERPHAAVGCEKVNAEPLPALRRAKGKGGDLDGGGAACTQANATPAGGGGGRRFGGRVSGAGRHWHTPTIQPEAEGS